MEKEINELKRELEIIKQELKKLKKALENHRHDGHGFTIVDN